MHAGGGAPLLERILGGLAVLAIQRQVQGVGEPRAQRVHLVGKSHPGAGLVVIGAHVQVVGAGEALHSSHAEHVGVGAVLVALHGEPEALAGGRFEHKLAKHAATVAALRVGRGAGGADAVVVTHVLRFAALAVAHGQQA